MHGRWARAGPPAAAAARAKFSFFKVDPGQCLSASPVGPVLSVCPSLSAYISQSISSGLFPSRTSVGHKSGK
jgi:hypothetical protein